MNTLKYTQASNKTEHGYDLVISSEITIADNESLSLAVDRLKATHIQNYKPLFKEVE